MSLIYIEPGGPLRPRKDPGTHRMSRAGGSRALVLVGAIALVLFAHALVDYVDRTLTVQTSALTK